MTIPTELYSDQSARWPAQGRHILAHYDADTIIVYQAYRPSIGEYAIGHGTFGGDFSYARMSWIKPNFLWMMYRSGWGAKEGQEITLALRLRRAFFDSLLAGAVGSSYDPADGLELRDQWVAAINGSDVRLQWDPDHSPGGGALARRAIQLGLRGAALDAFGQRELLEVIDMTAFVAAQRETRSQTGATQLRTPAERVYRPQDEAIAQRLRLDPEA